MTRTTLQIPLDTALRNKAEKAAIVAGFSSTQEIVRVFLSKLASRSIEFGFIDKEAKLSKKAENRYASMIHESKQGKNIVKANTLEELVSILE